MTTLTEGEVIRRAKRMFKCDAARVSAFPGKLFLIIGRKRRSEGEWYRNGKPISFDYLKEQVIANGKDYEALWASAREYKRLLDMERRYGPVETHLRILAEKLTTNPQGGKP